MAQISALTEADFTKRGKLDYQEKIEIDESWPKYEPKIQSGVTEEGGKSSATGLSLLTPTY